MEKYNEKKLIKTILASILASCSMIASAVPNYWDEEVNRGFWHINITNAKNQGFSITCSAAAGEEYDHKVYFSSNINNDRPWINLMGNGNYSILINNKTVVHLPSGTNYRLGMGDWTEFTDAIEIARNIKIYRKNKLVATFTPKNLNVMKNFSEFCDANF